MSKINPTIQQSMATCDEGEVKTPENEQDLGDLASFPNLMQIQERNHAKALPAAAANAAVKKILEQK